ncbi:TonB-dependent receptor [Saccharicrinis sp. GN24d3]|uniref:TonB-dependent receptor n=1 Tax=Saccharicrinis sp. GN24d3 TaxID=3458416 RepID=UPI0040371E0C
MRKYIIMCSLLVCFALTSRAQMYSVTGVVNDEEGIPLPGCHVHYADMCDVTDSNGGFEHEVPEGKVNITFSFVGYHKKDSSFFVTQDVQVEVLLKPDNRLMTEIAVVVNGISRTKSKKNEVVNANFVTQNQTGTFIKSIERLPGVNAMDIGAHASKPIIRGMGFNRVVVSENGVKQEGQQWGADHGLELDPFSIEMAEVVKGASGLEYGSDAIGGYINITNNKLPTKHSFSGDVTLIGKSVNDNYGGSLSLTGRSDKYFFKARASAQDYGDYRIPSVKIRYLETDIPIYNNRLKNTAGEEKDLSVLVGRITEKYKTTVSASSVYQKSGFFQGAHGVPKIERVAHDGDYRNIDYPYQKANHLKVLSQTRFFLSNGDLAFYLGLQDNLRQEWSTFHTHYSNQTAPETNKDLELEFRLKTYSANVKYQLNASALGKLRLGLQYQLKDNDVTGYNYLLPQYDAYSLGGFVQSEYPLNDRLKLNGGFRYDYGSVETHGFYDDILFDYLTSKGDSNEEAALYAQRSTDLNKDFGDISWLVGLVYKPNDQLISRMNLGTAFRMPTPIELGANGVHHGSFRHEKGDGKLGSEKGYYIDANLEWDNKIWMLVLSPYLYYFSNYLYLQPTGEFSKLPHAGQIYRYSQTKAMLSGVEFSLEKKWFNSILGSSVTLEYIYNQRISDSKKERYPLPFTPPFNGFAEVDCKIFRQSKSIRNTRLFLNSRFALKQSRISNNEEETNGYIIGGAGVSTEAWVGKQMIELVLQGSNLLNTKYFNHISFYRRIEIPEQGRNLQLLIKVPFNHKN